MSATTIVTTKSGSSASYKVTPIDNIDDFLVSNEKADEREKMLENLVKITKNNIGLLDALCEISVVDGAKVDSECCQPVDKNLLVIIMNDAVALLTSGKMKVNGKLNNWNNGCFGSIWFDLDASKYGVDYIRCAFYSKKDYKGNWKCSKNYRIQIMVEKSK